MNKKNLVRLVIILLLPFIPLAWTTYNMCTQSPGLHQIFFLILPSLVVCVRSSFFFWHFWRWVLCGSLSALLGSFALVLTFSSCHALREPIIEGLSVTELVKFDPQELRWKRFRFVDGHVLYSQPKRVSYGSGKGTVTLDLAPVVIETVEQ